MWPRIALLWALAPVAVVYMILGWIYTYNLHRLHRTTRARQGSLPDAGPMFQKYRMMARLHYAIIWGSLVILCVIVGAIYRVGNLGRVGNYDQVFFYYLLLLLLVIIVIMVQFFELIRVCVGSSVSKQSPSSISNNNKERHSTKKANNKHHNPNNPIRHTIHTTAVITLTTRTNTPNNSTGCSVWNTTC